MWPKCSGMGWNGYTNGMYMIAPCDWGGLCAFCRDPGEIGKQWRAGVAELPAECPRGYAIGQIVLTTAPARTIGKTTRSWDAILKCRQLGQVLQWHGCCAGAKRPKMVMCQAPGRGRIPAVVCLTCDLMIDSKP